MSDSDSSSSDHDIYSDMYSEIPSSITKSSITLPTKPTNVSGKRRKIEQLEDSGFGIDSAEGIQQLGEDALLPPEAVVGGGGVGDKIRRGEGGGAAFPGSVVGVRDDSVRVENSVLRSNISALYRTARAELRRRDREREGLKEEIKELKDKLKRYGG
ncbi:hypothetical protein TrCOL_g5612 [Triparma columacea]|uniref:Uncharacterized protein n=1 Tax=Triparma columacea TaxID=722753 RepID=A0A9W7L921_9STRA|nr:hypothetical protein TrCOL_g5612 [Triparma columacea]